MSHRRMSVLFTFFIGTFIAALLGLTPGALAQTSRWEGRVVERVEFEPATQPLSRQELLELLPLRVGGVLHASDVRGALQALYETGRFSDVAIDVDDDPGNPARAALRIRTTSTYFLAGVGIAGVGSPPNRSQLLNAAKLELGAPFSAEAVGKAVENMQERLRANGLHHAKIDFQLMPTPATEEMAVHFDLQPGARAHFDGVRLLGEFKQSTRREHESMEAVMRATRWRHGFGPVVFPGWREATENRVQTGLDRVRDLYQKENRLQARVTLDQLDYHEKTNMVTPAIAIDAGPVIEIRATGARVSRTRLRQLIPIYEERSVDQSLLAEGSRNLVDYFQGKGFFETAVTYRVTDDTPEHQTIEYKVVPSGRHKLERVEIAGNKFFDTSTLRERLSIRESSLLRFRNGRYSPKLRDQDRDLIRDLYRSNGFRDAQVRATTQDDYQGRKDILAVRFAIDEGQLWLVGKLELEGAPEADAATLRPLLQSLEGQPFSEANLAADRDTILSYYFNLGYPDAAFDWTQTPSAEARRIGLRYSIRPGEHQFVRNILVHGLDTTRLSLVQGRIALKPGEPISQSEIAATQQKLYDLGIFSRVQTALQNPEGQEERKNILLQLDEANRYAFNLGVGAELGNIGGGVTTLDSPAGEPGFSPRISAGISRLNLFGVGHTANLQGRASNIQQRAVLSYIIPQFTGSPKFSLTVSGLFDDSRDVRTFASRRWEGSVQLARKIGRADAFQARLSFRRVTVLGTPLISPELIPLLSQNDRVGMISLSYVRDRRDNGVDTHRGNYNTIDAGVSLHQFGSETGFTRLLLRNSTYYPLGRDVVLARTLQYGYEQRLTGQADIGIPLAERFFGGGASSQRAFPDNQGGPRDLDTGFPLGGSALLFHQTELRFPLIGDNIGGVLFHDMGNIYSDIHNVSFRPIQRDIADFNYMVHAVGFGIRYHTPIGPLRVDLSYSPDSPRFYGFKGTVEQLLLGQGTLTNQRISVFQFHFSLGQTF